MIASLDTLGLSQNAFLLLRDLIQDRLGIYFDSEKRDVMGDKLVELVVNRGYDSFLDYYYLLKYDEKAEEEWQRVMDALSVQETYFWREFDQVRCMVDELVPEHFQNFPGRKLRIWSAACATGEEPLSIAMALDQAGWLNRAPIEIIASDASLSAIAKAKQGVYRERSFRAIPQNLMNQYFTRLENNWVISKDIQSCVQWRIANTFSDRETDAFAASDIIFCRNMFIYFSAATIRKTVAAFFRRMPSPGYLFVGASESLANISSEFQLTQRAGAFLYVKPGPVYMQ